MAAISRKMRRICHGFWGTGPGEEKGLSLSATGAAVAGNVFVGLGKLALGIFSLSLFTCVSALYTFGMVVAKCCALAGIFKSKNPEEQYRYYTLSGIILIITSLLYMGYSVRLFFCPATGTYHMFVALAIAAFTFTEIAINIRGVVVERHNRAPLVHALKMLSLASSLICLSLTQAAILSFASSEVDTHPAANGLIGLFTGGLAAGLGVYMVVRAGKIQAGHTPEGVADDQSIGGGGRHKTEPECLHPFELQRLCGKKLPERPGRLRGDV
ncbi:hypothetical protein LJB76_00210 [Clostridia bacterium OttesenSCG-928-O13]|nr:hypothetical protein [Clostridia bacterium OttesenSCG-928-O13]